MIRATPLEAMMVHAVLAAKERDEITNLELSKRSGVNAGTISNMLNFNVRASLAKWAPVLEAAGVELGWRLKQKEKV